MKCFSCGAMNEHYLCDDCLTEGILDKVFNEIRFYNPETCENAYLQEYASGLTERFAERDCIPDILNRFDSAVSDYYYCLYYKMRRDPRLEEAALAYLQTHAFGDIRTQNVLYDLLDNYIPNDFVKPKAWCEMIAESEGLCCELYAVAAKYFAMIGDYDISDAVADKALAICNHPEQAVFLFYSLENMISCLNKQKEDTHRYRTKKPYWPKTEERRRAVAMFYDERGIQYPRIALKPKKVPESEFAPLNECFADDLEEYCVFWCAETYTHSDVKCIYQIAAAKVLNGEYIDTFELFVRPWDATSGGKKAAAKEAGVSVDVIESAEDVDLVMPKFFAFVGDAVLVSTGALGNQAKLISRAARYAGLKEIQNEFYDLLDLAADTDSKFDFENNNRAYLLDYFSIPEGNSALEKAQVNKQLYDALKNYGE